MKIREAVLTPIAFADPPLLNAMGVHEPFALRSVLQLVCEDGVIGLGESYGDLAFLEQARKVVPLLAGHDVFDLPGLRKIVAGALGGAVFVDQHGLTGGFSSGKTLASVYSLFEVASLDAQGHVLGRPVVDLLGGRARDEVEFSAYLFYKYGAHLGADEDVWGEVTTPDALVDEARTMIDEYGFTSIKLKGGVFEPKQEVEGIRALADAFPGHPLRIDPNAAWTPETSIGVAEELAGVLEYLEDPTPGIDGMAEVAQRATMPLATNMCVVRFADVEPAFRARAVGVVLSDHHFWGGLRDTQALSVTCQAFGVGLSMHSNSHLGISLAAMVHVAAATPHLTYACDTHWPWKTDDVVVPGALEFRGGAVAVPSGPGLGVQLDPDALARLHESYVRCGLTKRDDVTYMRRYVGTFEPNTARWYSMRVTGYAYSWDVLEPGFADRARELGVAEVAVAVSYHATRAATPWSTERSAMFAPHSAFYRPVRDQAWGALRPAPAGWVAPDSAGDAVGVLNDAGIPAAAWLVLTHNSLLGKENPSLCVRNCFGEVYPWALCPSHPQVQEYAATVVAEGVRDLDIASVVLESCGQMGAAHQNHHEKTDAVWSPAVLRLLSVCCCPSCVDGPAAVTALRAEIRRLMDTGDLAMTADELPPPLAQELLATRHRATDELRHAVLAVVPQGVRTVLHGAFDPWVTGALPGLTSTAASEVDAVVLPNWPVTRTSVDAVAAANAGLPGSTLGSYITAVAANPVPDIAGYVTDLAKAGATELHLYHLGLAGAARWPDLRTAVDAAGRT